MTIGEGTRTRFATVLILLLVLLTGSIIGIALDRRLGAGALIGAEETSEGRGSAGEGEDSGSDADSTRNRRSLIVEQVGLSDEQQVEIDSIVREYRSRVRELHDEIEEEIQAAYQPRYGVLLEEVRGEIKDVLTPSQRVAYDSLLAEYDRRREERRRADSLSDSRG
jgi:hypothetical protein